MYLIGYPDRYIDRCIGRYIDRYSIDTRPIRRSTVDRCFRGDSTDVGPGIDRELIGQLPAEYRSTLGGMSVVYHSIAERESTDRNMYTQ